MSEAVPRQAARFVVRTALGLYLTGGLGLAGGLCSSGAVSAADGESDDLARTAAAQPAFVEVAEAVGLRFKHRNGMTGEFHFYEIMGAGVALLDYDRDGDLDVYLVQGGMSEDWLDSPSDRPTDRLFRNESGGMPAGRLRFTDVTESSGIRATGNGMGAAVGDIDNDGWVDLYVTNRGANQLWRNRGDGSFEEVADRYGVQDLRWSVPAAFFDYDRDGWLDLFVGNYLLYRGLSAQRCYDQLGHRNYCPPMLFQAQGNSLFRNLGGDGGVGFEDVSMTAGIDVEGGHSLGVGVADFDLDGWLDLYVANDTDNNFLWHNQGDGSFEDLALFEGAAVSEIGAAQSSMGVAIADYDLDSDEDIFLTHLDPERNTLYERRNGAFVNATQSSGLGTPSIGFTGFGTGWLDYDNDGILDLLSVNGAVLLLKEQYLAGEDFPLRQSNQLFRGIGQGRLEDVTAQQGEALTRLEVSRGAAIGDLDNDGDLDVVVTNNNGPVRLLENRLGQNRRWIGFRLWDNAVRRDMIGAWVGVFDEPGGQPPLWRRVAPATGYASSSDLRVHFGLGASRRAARVVVRWPSGDWEEWRAPTAGGYSTLHRGEGRLFSAVAEPCGETVAIAGLEMPETAGLEPEIRTQMAAQQELLRWRLEQSAGPIEVASAIGGLGELLHSYQLYGAAAEHYAVALDLDPDRLRWAYLLGVTQSTLGRWDEAAESLERARAIDPEHPGSAIRLGDARLMLNDPDGALTAFAAVVDEEQYRVAARVGLGRCYLALGRPGEAIGELEEARQLALDVGAVDHQLARAYRMLGDDKGLAQALARKGESQLQYPQPELVEVQNLAVGVGRGMRYGLIYLAIGRPELAVVEYEGVLAKDPQHLDARLGLARAHSELNHFETALEVLDAAPDELADRPLLHLEKGRALLRLERPEDALAGLLRAAELAPGEPEPRLELARALLAVGRPEAARVHLRWLRKRTPDDAEVAELGMRIDASDH